MAMNVWNSRGAGRRQRTLGLGRVDIVVPGADDLGELGERMRHYGVEARDDGRTVAFDDPWANLIRVTAAPRRRRDRPGAASVRRTRCSASRERELAERSSDAGRRRADGGGQLGRR